MKINDFFDFVIFQAALNSQGNFMKRENLFLQWVAKWHASNFSILDLKVLQSVPACLVDAIWLLYEWKISYLFHALSMNESYFIYE